MVLVETPEQQSARLQKIYNLNREAELVKLLKKKLKTIEDGMEECLNHSGCMKHECQQRWGILINKQSAFKEVIEFMEFGKGDEQHERME